MAEEHNLKRGKTIYLDLSSQKKPTYEGFKNWILIQDSDTEQKRFLFTKAEEYLSEKVAPFLNINEGYEEQRQKISVTTRVKTRLSKKIARKFSKKLNLNLRHQAIHSKMAW